MVWGNSQIMVPKEAQSGRVCDLMIIDGSRMPEEATADLLNLRELAVSTEGASARQHPNAATPLTHLTPKTPLTTSNQYYATPPHSPPIRPSPL